MKLENETLIPLDTLGTESWIKYNKFVYLIRADSEGTAAQFQYDGISCKQGFINGYIYAQFKTKAKYFQLDWWYNKTSWGKDYPKRIYFTDTNAGRRHMNADIENPNWKSSKWWDKAEKMADEMGRPSEKILESIIKTVIKRTKINTSIDFDEIDYGLNWWEAKIPIRFGNKLEHKGILTWENCD